MYYNTGNHVFVVNSLHDWFAFTHSLIGGYVRIQI